MCAIGKGDLVAEAETCALDAREGGPSTILKRLRDKGLDASETK